MKNENILGQDIEKIYYTGITAIRAMQQLSYEDDGEMASLAGAFLEQMARVGSNCLVDVAGNNPEALKSRASICSDWPGFIPEHKASRDANQKMLKIIGCDTELAKDGSEAVKLYRKAMKSGKPFDAVLLDLTIPGGMGGQETVKRLLEIDPDVKAIVSSGYSVDSVMANFREYGFSAVATKPFQLDELQEVLQSIMQERNE